MKNMNEKEAATQVADLTDAELVAVLRNLAGYDEQTIAAVRKERMRRVTAKAALTTSQPQAPSQGFPQRETQSTAFSASGNAKPTSRRTLRNKSPEGAEGIMISFTRGFESWYLTGGLTMLGFGIRHLYRTGSVKYGSLGSDALLGVFIFLAIFGCVMTALRQNSQVKGDKHFAKAIKKKAEQGDPEAQYNLGLCYAHGHGFVKDYSKAVKWFRKAAAQGDAEAQSALAGIDKKKEFFENCRKAAAHGNAEAQYNLGLCYTEEECVARYDAEAVKWFSKAAKQGIAGAQLHLGVCCFYGNGIERNTAEAVKWYRKAAEQGVAEAQRNLGMCHFTGAGVPKNHAEAIKWLFKAAEQGEALAQYDLGICYYNGQGVVQDDAEAMKWFRKAAEQGNSLAHNALDDIK
jgi:FOG: TPR repeat, SEL1 subfamily